MEEAFFRTHSYLVEHLFAGVRRGLMDEIDWNDRLIGIKGSRGVGKTTFLLQYAKEHFDSHDQRCLYVNMNNFYFQGHSISEFAADFVSNGGKVLLIDQIFKQPDWVRELRECYDRYPDLKIIFTGSSVNHFKEIPEFRGIVKSYNLRGFSLREYINLESGNNFRKYSLDEIVNNYGQITKDVLPKVSPNKYLDGYIRHGFYPFFLENRNFSENLLKTMNMMTEVDILLIKQIELKYLSKIKKLFYLLAVNGPKAPNISVLAEEIETSRATVMNYINYLSDARLINIMYPVGQKFPKKPGKVVMHNPNLMYAVYPVQADMQDVMETCFINMLWKDHKVNLGSKEHYFIVDEKYNFRVIDAHSTKKIRNSSDVLYARYNTEVGTDNKIPIWMFGFLY